MNLTFRVSAWATTWWLWRSCRSCRAEGKPVPPPSLSRTLKLTVTTDGDSFLKALRDRDSPLSFLLPGKTGVVPRVPRWRMARGRAALARGGDGDARGPSRSPPAARPGARAWRLRAGRRAWPVSRAPRRRAIAFAHDIGRDRPPSATTTARRSPATTPRTRRRGQALGPASDRRLRQQTIGITAGTTMATDQRGAEAKPSRSA